MRADKDEAAWKKLLELAMPLCEVHPFFGMLVKELSDLEAEPSADTKVDLVTDLRTAAAGRGGKDGYQRHYTVGL